MRVIRGRNRLSSLVQILQFQVRNKLKVQDQQEVTVAQEYSVFHLLVCHVLL